MLLVNLVGGPGSGKSTTSAYIFAKLKMKGYKTDLVGEEARDLIYNGATSMLENQILILGQQWQRITRLAKAGADVAICDSPLVLSIMYSQKAPYHHELAALVRKIEPTYPAFNIFVKRVKLAGWLKENRDAYAYARTPEGRAQAAADELNRLICKTRRERKARQQ